MAKSQRAKGKGTRVQYNKGNVHDVGLTLEMLLDN